MKIVYTALLLFFIPVFSFPQSTNRAQLKSALLNDAMKGPEAAPGLTETPEKPADSLLSDVMKDLEVAPEVIETYEKMADSLQKELGEEIRAENLKTIQVAAYGVTGYDARGNRPGADW